ncbi:putative membrane protein [Bacillus thuringiensis serovar morrisoni]|nr:putative membrane protein [Bacillus thuringiensis serovar morrisoni]
MKVWGIGCETFSMFLITIFFIGTKIVDKILFFIIIKQNC